MTDATTTQPAQRVLVSALEEGEAISTNGWQMNGFAIEKSGAGGEIWQECPDLSRCGIGGGE